MSQNLIDQRLLGRDVEAGGQAVKHPRDLRQENLVKASGVH